MSKFVEQANLPQAVDQLIIGEKYRDKLDEALRSLGIDPICCPSNPFIDERLTGHCDLSVLHVGGDTVFLASYLKNTDFSRKLEALGFHTLYPQAVMDKTYPKDAPFNLCLLKNAFYYAEKVSNQQIVERLINKGFQPLSVNQGYCRCSICIVNERSIITSDRGVYRTALENGLDCLLIEPGNILLDGFDYGFIGGSSFKISDDCICFTGVLDDHPDKDAILSFLEKHNVRPVFLTDQPIFDIGSAVPLTEK